MQQLHPLRLQYEMFSDTNAMMASAHDDRSNGTDPIPSDQVLDPIDRISESCSARSWLSPLPVPSTVGFPWSRVAVFSALSGMRLLACLIVAPSLGLR
jgi:hypothetical protein